MAKKTHHLGDLQYAIMRVLWATPEATVADVCQTLPKEHQRAPTTIATMLTKMERKGVVAHRADGRVFVYRAKIREADVHRSMVTDLTERLFEGDAAALVSHLLTEGEFDSDELSRIRALIDRQGKPERGHGR
ncbi:MAG: BlaI/MecI/CopY family transcriptional regulator [Planctomycetes bacterium]|nr:BlaI/MecI/CopY family transcriptional regulator [Planctomycetota bacterium]